MAGDTFSGWDGCVTRMAQAFGWCPDVTVHDHSRGALEHGVRTSSNLKPAKALICSSFTSFSKLFLLSDRNGNLLPVSLSVDSVSPVPPTAST